MRIACSTLVAFVLLLLGAAAFAAPPGLHVIPSGLDAWAGDTLSEGGALGGCKLGGASIQKDQIVARYRCAPGTSEIVIALRHPLTPGPHAATTDRFALVATDAPPALVAALAARVRAHEASFVWVELPPTTDDAPPIASAAPSADTPPPPPPGASMVMRPADRAELDEAPPWAGTALSLWLLLLTGIALLPGRRSRLAAAVAAAALAAATFPLALPAPAFALLWPGIALIAVSALALARGLPARTWITAAAFTLAALAARTMVPALPARWLSEAFDPAGAAPLHAALRWGLLSPYRWIDASHPLAASTVFLVQRLLGALAVALLFLAASISKRWTAPAAFVLALFLALDPLHLRLAASDAPQVPALFVFALGAFLYARLHQAEPPPASSLYPCAIFACAFLTGAIHHDLALSPLAWPIFFGERRSARAASRRFGPHDVDLLVLLAVGALAIAAGLAPAQADDLLRVGPLALLPRLLVLLLAAGALGRFVVLRRSSQKPSALPLAAALALGLAAAALLVSEAAGRPLPLLPRLGFQREYAFLAEQLRAVDPGCEIVTVFRPGEGSVEYEAGLALPSPLLRTESGARRWRVIAAADFMRAIPRSAEAARCQVYFLGSTCQLDPDPPSHPRGDPALRALAPACKALLDASGPPIAEEEGPGLGASWPYQNGRLRLGLYPFDRARLALP